MTDLLLERAAASGVERLIDCTTAPEEWISLDSWLRSSPSVPRSLSTQRHPGFGLHPWKVSLARKGWSEELEAHLCTHSTAIVGEVGLDLRSDQPPRAIQLEALEVQWKIAQKLDRPIVLHSVRASAEWIPLFKKWGGVEAQFHAFTGSPEWARQLALRGCWFSVGVGLLRLSREKARLLWSALPAERRMIETDAPDFSLIPGELQRPENLPLLAERLSVHLDTPLEQLREETTDNAQRLLGVI